MTPVERVTRMLEMEAQMPQKDEAGIYIPSGLDAAIKVKSYEECLKIMRSEERNETRTEAGII